MLYFLYKLLNNTVNFSGLFEITLNRLLRICNNCMDQFDIFICNIRTINRHSCEVFKA